MDDISNRTLALLLISAIVVTLATTVWTLNSLTGDNLQSGRATSGTGRVNLSVENAMSIRLLTNALDFGTGIVNDSRCTNATLYVDNAGYHDDNDCWGATSGVPITTPTVPFRVENDGNQNVTLTIRGPTPFDFFGENAGLDATRTNLSWKGYNHEAGACGGVAGNLITAWTTFDGSVGGQTVCSTQRFGFTNATDELHVHIRVQIPAQGLAPAEYRNDTIMFTAS